MSLNTNDPLCGKVEIRKPIRFFIPVRIKKGEYRDGITRLLVEWMQSLPTNKEMRESGMSAGERREVVMEGLNLIAERKGKDRTEKILIRRDLERYVPCFTRLDCDDTGIELRIVHEKDGGPSDLEFGGLFRELVFNLGAKKVEVSRLEEPSLSQGMVRRIEVVNELVSAVVEKGS